MHYYILSMVHYGDDFVDHDYDKMIPSGYLT